MHRGATLQLRHANHPFVAGGGRGGGTCRNGIFSRVVFLFRSQITGREIKGPHRRLIDREPLKSLNNPPTLRGGPGGPEGARFVIAARLGYFINPRRGSQVRFMTFATGLWRQGYLRAARCYYDGVA